jgi:glc operon protein GlcG
VTSRSRLLPAGASVLALALSLAAAAGAESLSLLEAKAVGDAAEAEARRLGAPGGAIAVVDEGGHLVYLTRLDGTFPAAATVSTEKARTSAVFRKPTADFENAIKNGREALLGVGVMTPLQGGVPILHGGQVVGAVGVSGAASAPQDEEIARVAAKSAGASAAAAPTPTSHFPGRDVDAAFAKGAPLLENGAYKIHASRREAPGQAEIHTRDTDIIYVLEGSATLVTGGELVDGKTVAQDEIRGASIAGGESREIARGDVLVVPQGTPHWFKAVQPPVLYYVVKVTDGGAAR